MKDSQALQQRYYEHGESYFWLAAHYDVVMADARPLLQRAQAYGPLKILDAGCGPGNLISRLESWGEIVAVDASAEALEFCTKHHAIEVHQAPIEKMPFGDDTFDFAFAIEVIEHIEDDLKAISELHRVLKPGGCLIATVPAFMCLWGHHDEQYGHYRRYTKRLFCDVARQAGLRVERSRYIKSIWFLPLFIMRRLKKAVSNQVDDFHGVNPFVNTLFHRIITTEAWLFSRVKLPFGASLCTILRKAGGPPSLRSTEKLRELKVLDEPPVDVPRHLSSDKMQLDKVPQYQRQH